MLYFRTKGGGQDELVFDGQSLVIGPERIQAEAVPSGGQDFPPGLRKGLEGSHDKPVQGDLIAQETERPLK